MISRKIYNKLKKLFFKKQVTHNDFIIDNETINLILASNFFDEVFYINSYKSFINKEKPLDFFCNKGLALGHMPSKNFDPSLYIYLHKGYVNKNPIKHYLKENKLFKFPKIEDIFPDLIERYSKNRWLEKNNERKISQSKLNDYKNFSKRTSLSNENLISNNVSSFLIKNLDPSHFRKKLEDNEPFAFARLTHAYWDAIEIVDEISLDNRLNFLPINYRRSLSKKIISAARPFKGIYAEGFIEELEELIPLHKKNNNFYISVAFKGYADNDKGGLDRIDRSEKYLNYRLNAMSRFFNSKDQLYDATYPKQLAAHGLLNKLPNLVSKHPVIVVGSKYLSDLGSRWRLNNFIHVEILPRRSQDIRWDVLANIKNSIPLNTNDGLKPIILFEAGTLAYWLISKLFSWNPNIFYIDMGQSLSIWYPEDSRGSPWLQIHKAANEK
jgi:hypothetical protein